MLFQEMPKPSPEMAKLDYFEGNWTCQGKMNQSPMGPAGTMTSTARIQDDLGGFWQSGSIQGTMAGAMQHSWEMQTDGKWMALGDETCKK